MIILYPVNSVSTKRARVLPAITGDNVNSLKKNVHHLITRVLMELLVKNTMESMCVIVPLQMKCH